MERLTDDIVFVPADEESNDPEEPKYSEGIIAACFLLAGIVIMFLIWRK